MDELSVKELSIEFQSGNGYLPAVTELSFHLEKGEILALVGESGCGKSISCMALAGLLPEPPARVSSGEVLFRLKNGEIRDLRKISKRELRKIRGGGIAYIFQEPAVSLNPVFRVGDQIAEAIELHRPYVTDVEAELVSLLEKVGIPEPAARARAYPHELSGGMQQRIMIAMALASHPSVLIADEPTTALDVTIQAQILELLSKLRDESDMSVILVTHNLGIVSEMADRVCVMYAGKLMETAKVRELIDHPAHPYTAALLKAVPVPGKAGKLSTIPGSVPPPEKFPKGCRFSDRCEKSLSLPPAKRKRCLEDTPEESEVFPEHFCACHFAERMP